MSIEPKQATADWVEDLEERLIYFDHCIENNKRIREVAHAAYEELRVAASHIAYLKNRNLKLSSDLAYAKGQIEGMELGKKWIGEHDE